MEFNSIYKFGQFLCQFVNCVESKFGHFMVFFQHRFHFSKTKGINDRILEKFAIVPGWFILIKTIMSRKKSVFREKPGSYFLTAFSIIVNPCQSFADKKNVATDFTLSEE